MPNTVYANFILEEKLDNKLLTKVELSNYMTVDDSLTEAPGMKKQIHKYVANGSVEDLGKGEGNSGVFTSSFTEDEYVVKTTQGKGEYYDEEVMSDPKTVDNLVDGMAKDMNNDFSRKAVKEWNRFDLAVECDFTTSTADYLFNLIVDAVAYFGEDESGLTLLINPKDKAYARKQLGQNLKYAEDFVRTGYIGHVCGVPVVVSNAISEHCMILGTKEAVTCFWKKRSEAEQERDADHRKNTLFLRKYAVVALTDSTKVVGIAKAQSTACAITTYTKAQKTIAGTCGTDCRRVHVIDGAGNEYDATPTSGSWTLTAKANLSAGDKINAVAYADGKAPKAATEVTVAS